VTVLAARDSARMTDARVLTERLIVAKQDHLFGVKSHDYARTTATEYADELATIAALDHHSIELVLDRLVREVSDARTAVLAEQAARRAAAAHRAQQRKAPPERPSEGSRSAEPALDGISA
jgi:hypothetical protein